MNKKLLIVAMTIALLAITGCASTGSDDAITVETEMSAIIEVPEKTADELFVLANSWAVDTFNSAEAVIEFSDKEAGMIKGTFSHSISGLNTYATETTMTIEVREGRVRITFDDPRARMTSLMGQRTNPNAWPWDECSDSQLEELNEIWSVMILDFRDSLNAIEENW